MTGETRYGQSAIAVNVTGIIDFWLDISCPPQEETDA